MAVNSKMCWPWPAAHLCLTISVSATPKTRTTKKWLYYNFSVYILVQRLVTSEFVTSVDSWVMLKLRRAHLWGNPLLLAVRRGEPSGRI